MIGVKNDAFILVKVSHQFNSEPMNGILEVGLLGVYEYADILFGGVLLRHEKIYRISKIIIEI